MLERLPYGAGKQTIGTTTHSKAHLEDAQIKEVSDFQRTYEILTECARLERSLQRQNHARLVIRTWRYIHIPLACVAIVMISYHSIYELWKLLVLHY
jgi:hypothetical protein